MVLAISGIASAVVDPQNRGPGTVDIFITGPNNSIPSDAIIAEAQAVINAGKVATDDVEIQVPTLTTISATLSIHIEAGYDTAATKTAVITAVSNYIDNLGMGGGILGYAYASQFVAVALAIVGVANATTTFTDTQILPQQLPQAGTITVGVV
jgi:uncharacterized phage protein gp47/JayE